MKINKLFTRICLTLLFVMLLTITPANAQCPLCKAQVESSLNEGSNVANGLNNGILILLASPYILIGTIAFIWYKRNQKAKALTQS